MDYIVESTTEAVNSIGGIALVGKILERLQFASNDIKHPHILKSIIGLISQGRTSFEEIALFRNDQFFRDSLGLKYVPAKETLRLYLEEMVNNSHNEIDYEISRSVIQLIRSAQITPITIDDRKYIPVDIDTSPMDNSKSHKEGVSRTYKQFDGYHPIFSYIGSEGYMINTELRKGKQHCQKGTPEFLEHTINMIEDINLKAPLLFRLDSGNDSKNIIDQLEKSGHYYIIKRNLRKELPAYWLDTAKAEGIISYQDEYRAVYTGVHTGRHPANNESYPEVDIIFQVTEKFMDKEGNRYLIPELKVETFWSNICESSATVIELYHDHGTSEQFHSELKTDMNVERLPSGKFSVNSVFLKLANLTFNILRYIGQTALSLTETLPYKTSSKRKRLRKVIDDLIRVAVKIVTHSRKKIIKLWDKDPWFVCYKKIYERCCQL